MCPLVSHLAVPLPPLCGLDYFKCFFPKELEFYYSGYEVEAAASICLKSDSVLSERRVTY